MASVPRAFDGFLDRLLKAMLLSAALAAVLMRADSSNAGYYLLLWVAIGVLVVERARLPIGWNAAPLHVTVGSISLLYLMIWMVMGMASGTGSATKNLAITSGAGAVFVLFRLGDYAARRFERRTVERGLLVLAVASVGADLATQMAQGLRLGDYIATNTLASLAALSFGSQSIARCFGVGIFALLLAVFAVATGSRITVAMVSCFLMARGAVRGGAVLLGMAVAGLGLALSIAVGMVELPDTLLQKIQTGFAELAPDDFDLNAYGGNSNLRGYEVLLVQQRVAQADSLQWLLGFGPTEGVNAGFKVFDDVEDDGLAITHMAYASWLLKYGVVGVGLLVCWQLLVAIALVRRQGLIGAALVLSLVATFLVVHGSFLPTWMELFFVMGAYLRWPAAASAGARSSAVSRSSRLRTSPGALPPGASSGA